jgi:hypothetical protein
MEHLRSILYQSDMFNQRVNFRILNQDYHRTTLGVFCTIVNVALFIFCLVFFGKEVIEKKSPDMNIIK